MPRKKKEANEETIVEEIKEIKAIKVEEAKVEAPAKEAKKKAEKIEINKDEVKGGDNFLVPVEDYVKQGIHLGTKVMTADMKRYVYKRRADGLVIIDTEQIDKRLRNVVSMLTQYSPKEIVIVCKREAGWKPLEKLGELTGIRVFTKKYPAGIITNSDLPNFFECSIMLVSDQWLDKNPLTDAIQMNIPVIALCDTNNVTASIDVIVPCNNKSNKSLGLIFYIIAKEYCKAKKIKAAIDINDFVEE